MKIDKFNELKVGDKVTVIKTLKSGYYNRNTNVYIPNDNRCVSQAGFLFCNKEMLKYAGEVHTILGMTSCGSHLTLTTEEPTDGRTWSWNRCMVRSVRKTDMKEGV